MDSCTTRSDDCTSFFCGQPVGGPDTTGCSSNLGTSAMCICNCFCQWSTATSAIIGLTCDHAFGVSFCCAPYCRIFISHTSIYFECHSLKLNINLRNPKFISVQTNFCFYRTIQHGNKLNLSYVSINGIGTFIATRIYYQLYEVWSCCGNSWRENSLFIGGSTRNAQWTFTNILESFHGLFNTRYQSSTFSNDNLSGFKTFIHAGKIFTTNQASKLKRYFIVRVSEDHRIFAIETQYRAQPGEI